MKKFTILCLAIAMTAISVSAADDAKPKRPKLTIPADILAKYDKNKDGKINPKEDGLTKEEMTAYRADMKKAREAGKQGDKETPAPAPAPAPAK
jgi:hypothetical protein